MSIVVHKAAVVGDGWLMRGRENAFITSGFYKCNNFNYNFSKCASEGFTICSHTTSLTFDLTSDQEEPVTRWSLRTNGGRRGGRREV